MQWVNFAFSIVLASSGVALSSLGLDASAASQNNDSELLPLSHQTPVGLECGIEYITSNRAIASHQISKICAEKIEHINADISIFPKADIKPSQVLAEFSFPQQLLPTQNQWEITPRQSLLATIDTKSFVSGSAADLQLDRGENVSQAQGDRAPQDKPSDTTPQPKPADNGLSAPQIEGDPDLGILRLRQREVPQTPQQPTPPQRPTRPQAQRQPILNLLPRLSYFYTTNVFSGVDPVADSLILSSLTLWSAPELKKGTFLSASVDGSLVRYINRPDFNYNLLRARVGIRQRLTNQMFGEIGWNNQQFFRAEQGDRFLRDHAIYLSLSRRDLLLRRLVLDSYYDFRVNFSDPQERSRITNSVYLSLSYYLLRNLQLGLDYQYERSDFTQRDREDQYHRILGRFTYGTLRDSQISVLGGVVVGDSSESFVDFDSLFFSVTYSINFPIF